MVKVNGKPILEHLVNHLNKAGITEIIVNVHENYDKIFKYFGTRLLYLYEPNLLGEWGTEQLLEKWLGDRYIVMNGDTLTDLNITELIEKQHSTQFVKGIKYAGTKCVWGGILKETKYESWDGDGAYYFDCGTKSKLAKARRFFKCKRP